MGTSPEVGGGRHSLRDEEQGVRDQDGQRDELFLECSDE